LKVFSSSASSYALCENGLSLFVTFSCTNLTVKLLWLLQKSSWVVFWFLLSDENEVFLLRSSKIFFTLSLRCTSKHIWNQKIIQYDFVILLLNTYPRFNHCRWKSRKTLLWAYWRSGDDCTFLEKPPRERKLVEFHYSNMLIGKLFWYFLWSNLPKWVSASQQRRGWNEKKQKTNKLQNKTKRTVKIYFFSEHETVNR
jgi:hypothetical protein